MVAFGFFFPLAGSLRGAGDTRTPFYARLTGTVGFLLGGLYLFGIVLGYGLPGVYAAIVLNYTWWALVAGAGYAWGDWAADAAAMMAERADATD